MNMKLVKRFWLALVIFGLMGQVAWVVENMYLNVFLYKIFHGTAADISLMVGASAAAATVTTVLMGALSDHIGKRKRMICGGYIACGVSILAFALIRMETLVPIAGSTAAAAALGVTLVIALDCIMTVLGHDFSDHWHWRDAHRGFGSFPDAGSAGAFGDKEQPGILGDGMLQLPAVSAGKAQAALCSDRGICRIRNFDQCIYALPDPLL